MPVPNTFATATAPIPLSQLDANFATTITLGNTAIQLGNTVTTLNNMTLANVTVSSGNVTITNVSVTTANVTTANIGTSIITTSETLNYGTANGVAYLNGSKVLTTGTGLVFDGTSLGIGTSSPGARLQVGATTDSSNVLKATVSGSGLGYVGVDSSGTNGIYLIANNSGSTQTGVVTGALGLVAQNAYPLVFGTNSTERMRLDSSGNLGLGVTPSAWASTAKAFTVRSSGSGIEGSIANSGATNATSLVNNGYYNAGWKYVYSGGSFAAGRYDIEGGQHSWYTAASGTAGNAITFTQAMTLDASGNLLVGTTTATNNLRLNEKLAVVNAGSGTYTGAVFTGYSGTADANSCPLLELQRSRGTTDGSFTAVATSDRLGVVTFRGADGAAWQDAAYVIGACDGTPTSNTSVPGRLIFATTASGSPTPTERARIDASGYTQFNSNLVMPYQGAPTSKSGAATLTGAELVTGILNTTGTTYTITLPTGTNIEGALTWSANNVSLDWYVINTASGTITIGANGNTTLGSLTIATGTSAQFRIRRTAANTFTVYRLG